MKFIFNRIITIVFLFLPLFWVSCHGGRHSKGDAELPIDSLFLDLGKAQLEQRKLAAERCFSTMSKSQGLNGVVLYAEGGQILLEKAYGWRHLDRQRDSLTTDDQFQLGSVSKMFTAEAIMLLHSGGKLDYDDDVRKYIPEFPYQGITLRHLLNHRSGLSRYESLADEQWPNRSIPLSNDEMIKLYVKHHIVLPTSPSITTTSTTLCWPPSWSESAASISRIS